MAVPSGSSTGTRHNLSPAALVCSGDLSTGNPTSCLVETADRKLEAFLSVIIPDYNFF